MSDAPLQFDRAEFSAPAPGATVCAVCKMQIAETYFEVNGQMMCPRCKFQFDDAMRRGSPLLRFIKAGMLGLGAAAVSAAVYGVIKAVTGYDLALISILVGWAVGTAVRFGSENRGGWFYQGLAVLLTYLAVGGSNVQAVLREVDKGQAKEAAAAAAKPPADSIPSEPGVAAAAEPPADSIEAEPAAAASSDPTAEADPGLLAVVMVIFTVLASPVLTGMKSPITILIILFGLYQAWKMNKRLVFNITGPFTVGTAPVVVAAPPAIASGGDGSV